MAGGARARRFTRLGRGCGVTRKAGAHARQLVHGREFERLHRSVALLAVDAAGAVNRVIEAEIGRWDHEPRDLLRVTGTVADVAVAALTDQVGAGRALARAVVGAVAAVAACAPRQERVRAAFAGLGPFVARGAGSAQADVPAMVEANTEGLRGVNDVARPAV